VDTSVRGEEVEAEAARDEQIERRMASWVSTSSSSSEMYMGMCEAPPAAALEASMAGEQFFFGRRGVSCTSGVGGGGDLFLLSVDLGTGPVSSGGDLFFAFSKIW
jgi:hypothetical protein